MNRTPTNNHSPLNALAAQANGALAPRAPYSTTPTTRNGDGFHRTEKPTSGDGQWVLVPGAKLPPRAFEVHERERHRFHVMARCVPLDDKAPAEVQRIGGEVFDATFGAEAAKFEYEITAGRVEVERIHGERARIERDIQTGEKELKDIPATTEEEQVEPRLPVLFSAKGLGFVVCLMLLLVSSSAAVFQIANLYLPSMQSWLFAAVAATPWILAAVAMEVFLLLTLRTESSKFAWALRGAVVVLMVGIILWVAGLFPLAAPLSQNGVTATTILVPDRRWAVTGQLLCELSVSFLLLTGMLKLLTYRSVIVPNENRRRISEHVAALSQELARENKELDSVLDQLANPEGNLREWRNSRAAFVQEGLSILQLRAADAALLNELQRQRGENQRLLSAFNVVLMILALLFAPSAFAAGSEPVNQIVIGVSPWFAPADRTSCESGLTKLILADSPNGCRITLWDAWNLRVVGEVHFPRLTYDSPAARAPRAAPALAGLKNWFASQTSGVPETLRNSAAVKAPEFVRAVTPKLAPGRSSIVILGRPHYLSMTETAFSMQPSPLYPSDAHLERTNSDTPFGVADSGSCLTNASVHWFFPGDSMWASEKHRLLVTRFWSLWSSKQSGTLASFSGDLPQVLMAATHADYRSVGEFTVNTNDNKLVMYSAVPRVVPVEIQARPVPPAEGAPPRQMRLEPPPVQVPVSAVEIPPSPVQLSLRTTVPLTIQTVTTQVVHTPRRLITCDVSVADATGRPVSGLSQADFRVYEDGAREEIVSFSHERTPISIAVLIDTSGSIGTKLNRILAAAASLIRQGYPGDEWAVMEFKGNVTILQDFTTNGSVAQGALNRLKAGGETALLDAVRIGVQYANEKGKHERKAVVLVTDGAEANSRCNRDDVLPLLRSINVQFYAIGFPEGLNQTSGARGLRTQPTETSARSLLDELANASSGGRAFYPKQTAELDRIAESIAAALRTPRYRLSYYSDRRNGEAREAALRVEVLPSAPGVVARARRITAASAGITPSGGSSN